MCPYHIGYLGRAAGVVDFELLETENETYVRVWTPDEQDGSDLRKQIAAILPGDLQERHIIVVSNANS